MARSRTVVVIQHHELAHIGLFGDVLQEAGIDYHSIRVFAGETIPDTVRWAGVVSLGGEMGAYEEQRYPWLRDEKAWLVSVVQAGVPVLGICLGCQLLADALGGSVFPADEAEIGLITIWPTPAGRGDDVGRLLDMEVVARTWGFSTLRPLQSEAIAAATCRR